MPKTKGKSKRRRSQGTSPAAPKRRRAAATDPAPAAAAAAPAAAPAPAPAAAAAAAAADAAKDAKADRDPTDAELFALLDAADNDIDDGDGDTNVNDNDGDVNASGNGDDSNDGDVNNRLAAAIAAAAEVEAPAEGPDANAGDAGEYDAKWHVTAEQWSVLKVLELNQAVKYIGLKLALSNGTRPNKQETTEMLSAASCKRLHKYFHSFRSRIPEPVADRRPRNAVARFDPSARRPAAAAAAAAAQRDDIDEEDDGVNAPDADGDDAPAIQPAAKQRRAKPRAKGKSGGTVRFRNVNNFGHNANTFVGGGYDPNVADENDNDDDGDGTAAPHGDPQRQQRLSDLDVKSLVSNAIRDAVPQIIDALRPAQAAGAGMGAAAAGHMAIANSNTLGTSQAVGHAADPNAAKYKGVFKATTITSALQGIAADLTLFLLPAAPSPLLHDPQHRTTDSNAPIALAPPSISSRLFTSWPHGHSGDPNTDATKFLALGTGAVMPWNERPVGAIGMSIPSTSGPARKLSTHIDWVEAWYHYTDVVCSIPMLAHLRPMMNKYQFEITMLCQHFPFFAVMHFDTRFRKARAGFKDLDLDHSGTQYLDLYAVASTARAAAASASAVTTRAASTPQHQREQPPAPEQRARTTASKAEPQSERQRLEQQKPDYCRNWNRGTCTRDGCRNTHACLQCDSADHPMSRHSAADGSAAPVPKPVKSEAGKGRGRR